MPETEEKTHSYKVTKKAGTYLAGRRSPGVGKTIKLTERQAETPLRNGEIEGGPSKKTEKKPSETASE